MSCIILVTGKTGAGKTTFADKLIIENPSFKLFSLADKLKDLTFDLLKLFKVDIKDIGFLYTDSKKDYRKYLQNIGTECCRKEFGDDFWCEMLKPKIDKALKKNKNIVISDIRYRNEIDYFKKNYPQCNIFVVKIIREGIIIDSKTQEHSLEKEVDDIDANITFYNDESFEEKYKTFDFLLKHFLLKLKPKVINNNDFDATL